MAPRFVTILTGRNLPQIQQSGEPEPSTINEKTITDFTRVVQQTGILQAQRAPTGETSGSIAVRLKRSAAAIRKRAIYLGIVLAGSTKALGLRRRNHKDMIFAPSIWTLEIDGKSTLAFEAMKYREADEICHQE